MGLNFKELIVKEEISISELRGKVLAIDSMNLLYQFLTTIRSADGSVLTDSKGRVTSHLIGLFSRTTSLMEQGLKLVFVFDGKAPEIKRKTWEKRTQVKTEASLKLKEAEEAGDVESMKRFAARTAILTKEMREDAKKVIRALGLPIIEAPSEGEAQTAYMVKNGTAYASISQDYDNLIFGCPLLIRNLSIEGKRKKAGKFAYQTVKPEKIELKKVLKHLDLTLDQLIVLAILVGTDYNPGGVKGIGPKTGLKLLKAYGNDFKKIFEEVRWKENYPDLKWKEVFDTIKEIKVTDDYKLEWKKIDEPGLISLLVEEYGFSEERVTKRLEKLKELNGKSTQQGLSSFF
ncbi:MAG: flap endonuclease-1 [Nanoarchaeota archaeon]|nr:flap endonuclease-1 [Nanoarchaeota archaeon]MBU1644264.1 flap endonuclease-1 [Nanoarchaeota archaeon]MBU1976994.1 flap endonuclease-1 [Nanoarchaeota archaeon]